MSLFIALGAPPALDTALNALLSAIAEGGPLPRAGRFRPLGGRAAFHLTLAFLGQPGDEGLAAAREALASLEGMVAPILRPRGLFGLPPGRRHSVLCLGMAEEEKGSALTKLWECLNRRLRAREVERGIPPLNRDWPCRPLLPHISLARPQRASFSPQDAAEAARRMEGSKALGELEAPRRFASCILYESAGGPGGASYRELLAVTLGEGEDGAT